jgi:hypothetical protein
MQVALAILSGGRCQEKFHFVAIYWVHLQRPGQRTSIIFNSKQ